MATPCNQVGTSGLAKNESHEAEQRLAANYEHRKCKLVHIKLNRL